MNTTGLDPGSHPEEPPSIESSEPVEPRAAHLRRLGHHTRLYATAAAFVLVLVVVIALVVANTRRVQLSWVVGKTHASLVWIILVSVILGWLLGITTSVAFRYRSRRRRST